MSLFGLLKSKNSEQEVSAESKQEEIIQEEKQDMIEGVEGLSSTTVKEVMIPRIDVDFIPNDCSKEELIEKIITSGHSRFPVYAESTDNVIGVLYVKDLLKSIAEGSEIDIPSLVRKPYFVPESKIIHSLLREFKRRHLHIAIAIDEYGGIAGIVTMEDILEELVGEIWDEHDVEIAHYFKEDDTTYIVNGNAPTDIIFELFNHEDEKDNFEANTVSGWILEYLGEIPISGTTFKFKNLQIDILQSTVKKINKVRISLQEDNE